MLLLDASVWIESGVPGSPWHEASQALVRKPPKPLGAIDLTPYEIANVIGVRERRPKDAQILTQALRRRCHDRIVTLDNDLLGAALDAALEHGLTAYDAAYLAAAQRHGWKLVSTDIRDLVSKGLAVTPDAADYP